MSRLTPNKCSRRYFFISCWTWCPLFVSYGFIGLIKFVGGFSNWTKSQVHHNFLFRKWRLNQLVIMGKLFNNLWCWLKDKNKVMYKPSPSRSRISVFWLNNRIEQLQFSNMSKLVYNVIILGNILYNQAFGFLFSLDSPFVTSMSSIVNYTVQVYFSHSESRTVTIVYYTVQVFFLLVKAAQ